MKVRSLLIGVTVLFIVGLLATSTYAKIDPKTIVGMWLFDENKGDVAADSSGNKNDGKLVGSPKWVDGKFGKALQLDGSSSYVNCGKSASQNIPTGGSVTMCAWVNPKVGSTGAWQAVFAKREGTYSYGINFMTGNFQVYTSGASGIANFAYNLPANKWVFVCGTMSKKPTELYVDGKLFGAAGAGGGVISAENTLWIGSSLAAGEIFNGIIDEVAIFNVVLAAEDINTIMTKGLGAASGLTAVESSDKLATTWASIKTR
jgi:hypothetical protein